MEKELERVTRERDQLANQLREDAQLLDGKLSAAKAQGQHFHVFLFLSGAVFAQQSGLWK